MAIYQMPPVQGFLPGGTTDYWWYEPFNYGDIPVITAQATPRLGPHGFPLGERSVEIVDQYFITKSNNNIQLNFGVRNLKSNGFPYEVFVAVITPW